MIKQNLFLVEKQAEYKGVEMGVLENGIPMQEKREQAQLLVDQALADFYGTNDQTLKDKH